MQEIETRGCILLMSDEDIPESRGGLFIDDEIRLGHAVR
jgi:hypothetical protein